MIQPKEKAKQILKKYKFKFISKVYCLFFIWLIDSDYLKNVKNEIQKL